MPFQVARPVCGFLLHPVSNEAAARSRLQENGKGTTFRLDDIMRHWGAGGWAEPDTVWFVTGRHVRLLVSLALLFHRKKEKTNQPS